MKTGPDNGGDGAWVEIADWARLPREPVVSVAMLAYNHERYLAQAIEGVMKQEAGFPFELVIGVDASSDRTMDIALAYQRQHVGRIRVLAASARQGMHANLLSVLGACRGRYVAMCEGDDFWCSEAKLGTQVKVLDGDDRYAGCFHDTYSLWQADGSVRLRVGKRVVDVEPGLDSVILDNNIATCSMLYRNQVPADDLRRWLLQTRKCDYMLVLLVARLGKWRYLDAPMGVYRVHSGGIWSGMASLEQCRESVRFWETLESAGEFADVAFLARQRKCNEIRRMAVILSSEGRVLDALRAVRSSLGPRDRLGYRRVRNRTLIRSLIGGLLRSRLGWRAGWRRPPARAE